MRRRLPAPTLCKSHNRDNRWPIFQPLQDRKGDPDLPLSDAELEAKFFELTGDVLGTAARPLLDALWRIDGLASLTTLPFGEIAAKSATK